MTEQNVGKMAENVAAAYLETRGFKLIQRNSFQAGVEIDIIAQKNKVVYLCEVKYRRNEKYGGGVEAIDRHKLQRMERAALYWLSFDSSAIVRLMAITISGSAFEKVEIYEITEM